MERVPEPELMDDVAQARAYSEADFADAHDRFVRVAARAFGPIAGRVLDLGCGPADPTVRFARANPDAVITGVDAAAAMLDLARQRVAAAGLSDRINLRLTRLPDDALRGCEFDAVISNSLLHHLADPTVLWETVAACARPGAPIMVMDLVRPFDGAQVAHLVDTYASDADPILRADFANSLFAAYMPDEVAIQLVDAGVTGLRIDQVSDRHMVITGRR